MLGGIQHHFDNAVDVTIRGDQAGDIHTEAPRDRGAHLVGVQALAFDFARFHDILGEGAEERFLLEPETEPFHPAEHAALTMADGGELGHDPVAVPGETRPVGSFPDEHINLRIYYGDYRLHSPQTEALLPQNMRRIAREQVELQSRQALKIFPGFIRFSGSSVCLISRIKPTASPCSRSRKAILPKPMPCSPVQVPPIARARSTRRSLNASARFNSAGSLGSTRMVVWKFPSPTWPRIIAVRPVASMSLRVSTMHSARREIGTHTSVGQPFEPGRIAMPA